MVKPKTPEEIAKIRVAGRVVAKILSTLYRLIKVGNTGLNLDRVARKIIADHNCQPNFLGFHGFPNAICVSINSQMVHGIPSNYRFCSGDVVKIDVGCKFQGYHADAALTKIVDSGTEYDQKLVEITQQSLQIVINQIKPYNRVGDIGFLINHFVTAAGFYITPDYSGHGIGKELHEDPIILNFGVQNQGVVLKPNMVFCVEPMVLIGTDETIVSSDGWTVRSANDENTAHFEHTLLLTENGIEVLTAWEPLIFDD